MRQIAILALANMIASAVTLTTGKSFDQFGGCFIAVQERAGNPWSFVPKSNGGTFSNAGAKGVQSPYFVAVSDVGPTREIRLEQAGTDPKVAGAVHSCA